MGCHHKEAAEHGYENLRCMGWKRLSTKGSEGDAAQTARHQAEHLPAAMPAKAVEQGDGSQSGNQNGE